MPSRTVSEARSNPAEVSTEMTPSYSSEIPEGPSHEWLSTCRRIQVSREKRPLSFFVTLSKKFLVTDEVIELSGLGLAVTTVVTVAEILRGQNLVDIRDIKTSLVEPHPEGHAMAPKAKIQIWVSRTSNFESLSPTYGAHGRQIQSVYSQEHRGRDDYKGPGINIEESHDVEAGNTEEPAEHLANRPDLNGAPHAQERMPVPPSARKGPKKDVGASAS